MSGEQYLSSDDSELLRRALAGTSGKSFLEIGAGNAGALSELSKRFGVTVGTDLRRPGMDDWRTGANYLLTDTASCFRDSCFDLVAFNPPYLRSSRTGDDTVEGGLDLGVPMSFLREALRVVSPGGKVIFLLNDDADLKRFEEEVSRSGFGLKPLVSRRLFFEEITVYEASPLGGEASDSCEIS